MKKNLRIVSAAAALLAVAPVADSAVSVNAADSTATTTAKATDYTNINLGGSAVSNNENQVDVTPALTLNGTKGNIKASLTGSITASFGAKVVPSSEFSTSLDMVRQGRVKGTINSMSAWYAYKKDGKNVKGLQAKDVSKDEKPAKISALMAKKNTDLKKDVNKALKQLRNDGTLTKLSKKYVGGDITK